MSTLQFRQGDLIERENDAGIQAKWLILDNGHIESEHIHVYNAFWFKESYFSGKVIALLYIYPSVFKYNLLCRQI